MYKKEEDKLRKQKLNVLILLKQSRITTYQDLSQKTGNNQGQLSYWLSTYRKYGLEVLLGLQKRPKECFLKVAKQVKTSTLKGNK